MNERHRSVLSSGYIALDVIRAPSGTWLRAGGTAGNVAAILAYLGWHASVIGRIGDDDAGPIVERDLRNNGVETSRLQISPDAGTPLVVHEIAPAGHRFRFGCSRCGRVYRPHRPMRTIDIASRLAGGPTADVFFFDRATAAALKLARSHRDAGRLVVYEPGSAGRLNNHKNAAALADVVKFSDERRFLFEDALHAPQDGQLWIETQGERGARLRLGSGPWKTIEGFPVRRIDAGGAGDWFTAGLLTRLGPRETWRLRDTVRAVQYAAALAALACIVPGARTLSEVLPRPEVELLVTRLMHGAAPELSFRGMDESTPGGYCDRCRLPLIHHGAHAAAG